LDTAAKSRSAEGEISFIVPALSASRNELWCASECLPRYTSVPDRCVPEVGGVDGGVCIIGSMPLKPPVAASICISCPDAFSFSDASRFCSSADAPVPSPTAGATGRCFRGDLCGPSIDGAELMMRRAARGG